MANSTAGLVMSPIRIETGSSYRNPADTYRIFPNDSYRSANSTQRALFSQQGAAPLPRARSSSMSRYGVRATFTNHHCCRNINRRRIPMSTPPPYSCRHAAPSSPATLCQLVTPLVVHTAHEVNAVSVTGQVRAGADFYQSPCLLKN